LKKLVGNGALNVVVVHPQLSEPLQLPKFRGEWTDEFYVILEDEMLQNGEMADFFWYEARQAKVI
jgi:hypothetical protein